MSNICACTNEGCPTCRSQNTFHMGLNEKVFSASGVAEARIREICREEIANSINKVLVPKDIKEEPKGVKGVWVTREMLEKAWYESECKHGLVNVETLCEALGLGEDEK